MALRSRGSLDGTSSRSNLVALFIVPVLVFVITVALVFGRIYRRRALSREVYEVLVAESNARRRGFANEPGEKPRIWEAIVVTTQSETKLIETKPVAATKVEEVPRLAVAYLLAMPSPDPQHHLRNRDQLPTSEAALAFGVKKFAWDEKS